MFFTIIFFRFTSLKQFQQAYSNKPFFSNLKSIKMELKLLAVNQALELGLITKSLKMLGKDNPTEHWAISDTGGVFLYEEKKTNREPFEGVKLEIIKGVIKSVFM